MKMYDAGEGDEDETHTQKRLCLAKLYLESVKEWLGTSSPWFMAGARAGVYLMMSPERKENSMRLGLTMN